MLFNASLLRRTVLAVLASGLALFFAGPTRAQPSSSAGQEITIVVGTPAGGGYDAYARLVARHLGEFLPGKPGIIVKNMPGGGSLIAANWLANAAPKDGSLIAILPSGLLFEEMLGNSNARFDARKMNLLISLGYYTPIVAVWHTTPFMTARDLFTHDVLVGASGATSNNSVLPRLLNSLIHTKFKVINGYPGAAGVELALERGEVQAMAGDNWDFLKATRPDWLRDKKVRILLQARQTRNKDLSDVPTAFEFVSAKNRAVLSLLLARQTYSGLFLAPAGVPASVVAELRQGFAKMVADAEFKRDAQKSNLAIDPASGAQVTATLGKLFDSPQAVIERATAELRQVAPQYGGRPALRRRRTAIPK